MNKEIYDKRIELIKSDNKNPTKKELQESYGYLDYCLYCGQKITFLDRMFFNSEHSMLGSSHRYRCKDEVIKKEMGIKQTQEVMGE